MAIIIPPLPYVLTNGTVADANQVMGDLNAIVSAVNGAGAHNGPNADITSLSGLTTPLSVGQGGTGANTTTGALTSLGAAPIASPTFTGTVTTTGPVSLTGTPNNIAGVTNGSSAPAGQVGEIQSISGSSAIPGSSPIALVTLSLPPGDWDVWGAAQIAAMSVGVTAFVSACISATSGNFAGVVPSTISMSSATISVSTTLPVLAAPFLLAATTPVYLNVQNNFASGTCTMAGWIYARRRR